MCICTDTFVYISAGYNGKIKFIASHSARHSILLLSFIISYMYTYFFFRVIINLLYSLLLSSTVGYLPSRSTCCTHMSRILVSACSATKRKTNLWTERAARARARENVQCQWMGSYLAQQMYIRTEQLHTNRSFLIILCIDSFLWSLWTLYRLRRTTLNIVITAIKCLHGIGSAHRCHSDRLRKNFTVARAFG